MAKSNFSQSWKFVIDSIVNGAKLWAPAYSPFAYLSGRVVSRSRAKTRINMRTVRKMEKAGFLVRRVETETRDFWEVTDAAENVPHGLGPPVKRATVKGSTSSKRVFNIFRHGGSVTTNRHGRVADVVLPEGCGFSLSSDRKGVSIRLLKALASAGFVSERAGSWTLTEKGKVRVAEINKFHSLRGGKSKGKKP